MLLVHFLRLSGWNTQAPLSASRDVFGEEDDLTDMVGVVSELLVDGLSGSRRMVTVKYSIAANSSQSKPRPDAGFMSWTYSPRSGLI